MGLTMSNQREDKVLGSSGLWVLSSSDTDGTRGKPHIVQRPWSEMYKRSVTEIIDLETANFGWKNATKFTSLINCLFKNYLNSNARD